MVAGGLETPAIVVSLEHHGFGWLQEERQQVNSRKGKGHFIDGEGRERSLAQRFKGPVKQVARLR